MRQGAAASRWCWPGSARAPACRWSMPLHGAGAAGCRGRLHRLPGWCGGRRPAPRTARRPAGLSDRRAMPIRGFPVAAFAEAVADLGRAGRGCGPTCSPVARMRSRPPRSPCWTASWPILPQVASLRWRPRDDPPLRLSRPDHPRRLWPRHACRRCRTRWPALATPARWSCPPRSKRRRRRRLPTPGRPRRRGLCRGRRCTRPVEVTEAAIAAYAAAGADCVVSLGGGSTTGLGKAIALRTGADQVVIPTTYAGSEMTDILGETAGGEKTTRRDPAIRPEVVVYDVDLTLTLPLGADRDLGPERHRPRDGGLLRPRPQPGDRGAEPRRDGRLPRCAARAGRGPAGPRGPGQGALRRLGLFDDAWARSRMALHHKLAHVLGGSFGLPHAETHAVLLPAHHRLQRTRGRRTCWRPIADIFGMARPGAAFGISPRPAARRCGWPILA